MTGEEPSESSGDGDQAAGADGDGPEPPRAPDEADPRAEDAEARPTADDADADGASAGDAEEAADAVGTATPGDDDAADGPDGADEPPVGEGDESPDDDAESGPAEAAEEPGEADEPTPDADAEEPAADAESPPTADAEPTPDAADDADGTGEASGPAGEDADDATGFSSDHADHLLGGLEGPEEDREMPLADHVEEMLRRLAVVLGVAGLVSLFVFPFADRVINFLWYSIMPGVPSEIARPRVYGVLEKLFTELKVASLAGLIVALPVLVYETYAFMRPGLYPHERRYYLAAVPTSLVLAIVGVSFAFFVVLPAIFVYFLYYSQDVATIGFALGRTFDLILLMMGYLAIVFQIPLFLMLAMMMGLVTRRWLADRRLLFWGAFLGISFIFGFDPTGMAPIIVAATMIVLFEGTLLLTKWTGRE